MAKDSRGLRLFSVGVLALCAAIIATPGHAAVGRTAGSVNVSNSGSFNYTIPIFTPPGPKGVQPSVALTYNSNGGGGVLGRGWSLSGEFASSMRTCPATIAQDGYAAADNRFCLDGNRLRVQNGLPYYGTPGSTYFTEVAEFSRITLGTDGSNNIYWVVQRKDGLTYFYGTTSDSRIAPSYVTEWKLSEIRDRAHNKVRFTWKAVDGTTSGTTHLVKIEWTQTYARSGSYIYSMDFIYSAGGNAANSSYYYKRPGVGVAAYDYDLLTAITVSTSGTVKRKYVMTYGNSPTTAGKRLTQVQECSDSAGTDCLSPTTITYQGNVPGVETVGTGAGGESGEYDFNGDGFKDLIYNDGTWKIRPGSATGYGSPIDTGLAVTGPLLAGKLTEAPGDQLLIDVGGTWHAYFWNGSSFSYFSAFVTVASTGGNVILADVNADGRDDMVYTGGTAEFNQFWKIYVYVRLNTATTGYPSFASPITGSSVNEGYYSPNYNESWAEVGYCCDALINISPTLSKGGDSDGDGREEVNLHVAWDWCFYDSYYQACFYWSQYVHSTDAVAWFDTYMNLQVAETSPIWTGYGYSHPLLTAADFNGDGCNDFMLDGMVGLSACYSPGGVASWVWDDSGGWFAGFADWNGDGRDDYFLAYGPYYADLYVRPFVGNTMGTAVDTGLPGCGVARTDGNGDGLDDILCGEVYNHKGTNEVPDRVAQIVDGFGVTYTPTYTTIAPSGSHTPSSGATYPYRDMRGGLQVVTSVTASDGIGGTYHTDYHYHGAQMNVHGRGFMGFSRIESTDSRNGIRHEQEFERAFPYSGSLKADRFYQPGGTLISEKILTMASATLDSTPYNERYFRYISAITENVKEVGGAKNGQLITSTATSNTYDSATGNLTATTRTVTDKDSSSPTYLQSWTEASSVTFSTNAERTIYWCLQLPDSISVTYSTTVSGESSVTRSKAFTQDFGNCRMVEEYVEPSSSTLQVLTTYIYDAFDNVNQVAITGRNPNGSNMATRWASTNWGTTGQFPVSAGDTAGQTITRTFHPTFGSVLTKTDPNGIVVTNEYDGFGRITRSLRADGTATRISYNACATYGCQNGDPASGATGINKMIVIASERDTGDNPIRDTWSYTDQFDRSIVQLSQTLAGGYSRTGRQYDALGRVDRETAPCTSGSCTAYWVTNTYDLLGRPLTQSRPFSDSNATPVTTTFAYAGRAQTITDPNSKVTTKVMDVNGRMRQSRDHDSYGQNFSYDAAGSLKGVTDTLSNTLFTASYGYGAKPFQTATTDMDLGSWSYTYNSLGELLSWTDANSNSFSQTYDGISRVTSRTESEGTTTFTYGTSAGSHNIGQLSEVSMSGYSEALSYDSIGRPSTRSITADSDTYNIDYAYNTKGLLDTLTWPTSTSSTRVKVKYGYANGILQSVTDWTTGSAGTVYWTANTQNPRGQTTQETLGNGVVTNRNFDAVTGRLNSIQSGLSGGTGLQNQSYLYDALGNVTQRQESTLGLTESFYYDNLYRLDYSTLNNGGGAATNLDLTYNAMGNITQRSDVNGNAAWTYHGTRKHAVATTGTGGTSYSYDNNGNMTSRGGQTIGWSSYNYPTYLTTATENTYFTYGPDRQYYKQDYTGPSVSETTYYIGGILEKVISGGTTDWRHTIMAEGQTVAIVSRKSGGSSANTVSYPLEDNQGSGSTLTNSSGSLLVRQSYEAFGEQRDGDDWAGSESSGDLTIMEGISRRGYTGHSMLGRMGLIHMNGRVQDAVTGRFLSPDPFVTQPGFTQGYNRYAYVNNNPLTYIDPSGFDAECIRFENEQCLEWTDLDEIYVVGCDWLCRLQRSIERFCARSGCNWDEPIFVGQGLPLYYPGSGSGAGTNGSAPSQTQQSQTQQQEPPQSQQIPCLPGVQCHIPSSQQVISAPGLLGTVYGGETKSFVAGFQITLEPFGMAQGAEMMGYSVNYSYIDRYGNVLPNLVPPNMPPFYTGGAVVGFGGGAPDVTLLVPNNGIYSGISWTVSIPSQQATHDNNSWGAGIRVYGPRP